MSELKRWIFEDEGNGVLVCKDQHEKGSPCEYEPLTAKDATRLTGCIARKDAEITTLRQKLADSEARVAELDQENENALKYMLWLGSGEDLCRVKAMILRKQAEAVEDAAKYAVGLGDQRAVLHHAQRLRQQADELEAEKAGGEHG